MSQKILKIHPLPKSTTVSDVATLLSNFKLKEIKIKKDSAYVRFSYQNKEKFEKLQKHFPNGQHEIQGHKITLTLIEQSQTQDQLPLQKASSSPIKMKKLQSLDRKHTVQTNIVQNLDNMDGLNFCLQNNAKWAKEMTQLQPDFFQKYLHVQKTKYLWIGCADSRVPANQIVGLKAGQLFVHRNVANIVCPSDINVLAVIQYAVEYLQVEDIIICGHYGCGGVKSSYNRKDYGLLESWLSNLRQIRARYHDLLELFDDQQERINKLVQLNVQSQVLNLSRIPLIQKAWKNNKKVKLHGLVYRLKDGILHDLKVSMDSIDHVPQQYRIVE